MATEDQKILDYLTKDTGQPPTWANTYNKWFATETSSYTCVEALTMAGFSPTLFFEIEAPAAVNKIYKFDVCYNMYMQFKGLRYPGNELS